MAAPRIVPATAADTPPPQPVVATKAVTRGVRNFNPSNIERTTPRTPWRGALPDDEYPHTHEAKALGGRFEVFISPEWGIRALIRVVITYYEKHRLNTVRKIIGRWAPPNENDTGAYVNAVAKAVGVGPDEPIDVMRPEVMKPLAEAIIAHECSGYRYPSDIMLQAMRLAGIEGAQPVAQTPAVRGASVAAAPVLIAGAGTAISSAVELISPHIPVISSMAGVVRDNGLWVMAVMAGLAVIGWLIAYQQRAARRTETGT